MRGGTEDFTETEGYFYMFFNHTDDLKDAVFISGNYPNVLLQAPGTSLKAEWSSKLTKKSPRTHGPPRHL